MKVVHLFVVNFKSLVHFGMPLAKFSCLIGLNGVGKSTLLQTLFISSRSKFVGTSRGGWTNGNGAGRISTRLSTRKNIEFEIQFRSEGQSRPGSWCAVFNTAKLRCTEEFVEVPPLCCR